MKDLADTSINTHWRDISAPADQCKRSAAQTMQSLTLQKLFRAGSSTAGATEAARVSFDFVVDGQSLLAQLVSADGGQYDSPEGLAAGFMGCFVKGFESDNSRKSAQLAAAQEPDTEEGRYLLYLCPECGDIGCGAYAAKVRLSGDGVAWYDFAYENGHEPGRALPSLGPFCFSRAEYTAVIGSAGGAKSFIESDVHGLVPADAAHVWRSES